MSNFKFKIIVIASVLAFFVADAFACDTWGSADYDEMMETLSLGNEYEGMKIINSFADEYRKNDCSHDEQMAIEIEVDGVGSYFYWDLNNYKKDYKIDFRRGVSYPH